MAIDRKQLICKHNPIHTKAVLDAPLTVGNGSLGFTADITGTQTLDQDYAQGHFPLLTMSDWGWHTTPAKADGSGYTLEDLVFTHYDCMGKDVAYPVEAQPGNEHVYTWLRQNPHRYHLGRVRLCYQGKPVKEDQLSHIQQTLDLYSGVLYSQFKVEGIPVAVRTCCHHTKDVLGLEIVSNACANGLMTVELDFPYPAPDITGANWDKADQRVTTLLCVQKREMRLRQQMDKDQCLITISGNDTMVYSSIQAHGLSLCSTGTKLAFGIGFSDVDQLAPCSFSSCLLSSVKGWKAFWEEGGIVSFEGSTDKRAHELERRMILSLYLSAVNCCNAMPPQETGLTVNSWFGKAHLEMYLWHGAYLPLWGRSKMLKKSLGWYKRILTKAIENAGRNGYKGAKWPKMVGPEGVDCPSTIAPLLIWQQPHLIYMAELLYQSEKDAAFLKEYWPLIKETAEYMADFPVYNAEKCCYDLPAPLIPAQECHRPMDTKNPTYELEYWRLGLNIACQWADRLQMKVSPKWQEVEKYMAKPSMKDGLYLAHESCPRTFSDFNRDHPSMVAALGLLPGDRIDPKRMLNTLLKIEEVWQFKTMWGWDFAMMAMSYTRLLMGNEAVNMLLYDTEKNRYVASGNNRQVTRTDLPLYLPGNGSLLLALPLMIAGFPHCEKTHPGFPEDGSWVITAEGIFPFPY